MKYLSNKWAIITAFLAVILLFGGVLPAAAENHEKNKWEVDAALYFWYASLEGETASGTASDVDASKLIDGLNGAFMGVMNVRKGDWSFMADGIYLSLEGNESGSVTLPDPVVTVPFNTALNLQGWVVTLAGGYNLIDSKRNRLDLLAGARYLWLDADLTLAGPVNTYYLEQSGDNWDAIIGIDGRFNLSKRWYLPYYLDIGTGESDLTNQVFAGVGYDFGRINAVLAYRYLNWNFKDKSLFKELNFSGPFAGIEFVF